jgi:O-antigen ligase
MKRNTEVIEKLIEAGILLYIVLMFLTKAEGVRNTVLFGSFFLFLISHRRNHIIELLRESITKVYLVFISVILLSIIISIDPLYSLMSSKNEPLKGLILFLMISTTLDSEEKAKRICAAFSVAAAILAATAFYSYFAKDTSLLKPTVFYMHLWHGHFARNLCITLPFAAALVLKYRDRAIKVPLLILLAASSLGLILSTSRTPYIAFIAMLILWLFFLSRRAQHRNKIIALVVMAFIAINTIALFSSPALRTRVMSIKREIRTMHNRADAWLAITDAIREKPVLGWGYGKRLVLREEPYEHTSHTPPTINPHNTFLGVTFASGLVGLLSYISILIYSSLICISRIYKSESNSFSTVVLLAALSVIVGNFYINAMTADVSFKELSIILGIVASYKNNAS